MQKVELTIRDAFWALNRSIKRRGVAGTVVEVIRRPWGAKRYHPPTVQDDEFDSLYGVDTGGTIPLGQLKIPSSNSVFGTFYGSTDTQRFKEIMANVTKPLDEYTFIDFGSGKGKALLLAAGYPFRKVIGVEFSPELNEFARANIVKYTGPRVSGPIEVVEGDATQYRLPDGPLMLYFCNPFDGEVMSQVIENINAASKVPGRPIDVLYFNPRMGKMFEDAGFEVVVKEPEMSAQRQAFSIYRVN